MARTFPKILRTLGVLALLLTGPACLKLQNGSGSGDGEELATIPSSGTGRNATVIATATNSLPRCGFTQTGEVEFAVECAVVVVEEDNKEYVATDALGVEFSWDTPRKVAGSEILSHSCESGYKNLSHNCQLTLEQPTTTEVELGLNRTDTSTNATERLPAVVLLAYSVTSYGLVPQIPIAFSSGRRGLLNIEREERSAMGFQTTSFDPRTIQFDAISSQCFDGAHYVSSQGFIYKRNPGSHEAEIFAGNANALNALVHPSTDHRLRVYFEPGELLLACSPKKPGLIYVLLRQKGVDPNGYEVPNALLKIYKIQQDQVSVVVNGNSGEGEYEWRTPPAIETALTADLNSLGGGAVGDDGSLYFSEPGRGIVRRLSADGSTVHLHAGAGPCANYIFEPDENGNDQNPPHCSFTGSGFLDGPSALSLFSSPRGLAFHDGKLYVADEMNRRIRLVRNGQVSTVAGGGSSTAEGALALQSLVNYPRDVAVDSAGTVYIAETGGHRIRKIANNTLQTIAGSGQQGIAVDGRGALSADLYRPFTLAAGSPEQLYFGLQLAPPAPADTNGRRVFELSQSQTVDVVFGESRVLSSSLASATQLREASAIAFHPNGDIYYTDAQNHLVMRIHKNALGEDVVSRFAGVGLAGCTNALVADPVRVPLNEPSGIAITANGDIYVSDTNNHRILRFRDALLGYDVEKVAGKNCGETPFAPYYNGYNEPLYDDEGNEIPQPPAVCGIYAPYPTALAADPSGNVYAILGNTSEILKIPSTGPARYFVGGCNPLATLPTRDKLIGITSDGDGAIYVSDAGAARIHKIGPSGTGTTIAGTGVHGSGGDGAAAIQAQFEYPSALAFDADRLYVVDGGNIIRVHMLDGEMNSDIGETTGGYHFSTGGSRIRVIEPAQDGTLQVNLLVGGRLNETCGTGSLEGSGTESGLFDQLRSSLSNFCRARIRALGARTSCSSADNQTSLLFAQSFSAVYESEIGASNMRSAPSSNIIRVDRQCF